MPNWFRRATEKAATIKPLDETVLDALRKALEDTDDSWSYITPEDLHDSDMSKYFLLDVRKPEAFRKGHIKGTKNIFWLDLLDDANLKQLPRDKKIVIICYVGHTASQMLMALKALGFDVAALKFGMGISPVEGVPVAGWTDFGFEVVTGK